MPLLPGEILNKRYRIVSLLAEGPYGAVYRAWNVREERDVAVKEVLDTSAETRRLFQAEARRLAGLSHPQLPAFRDHFGLEAAGQYLVSDYVPGVDLQALLAQYGPLPSDLFVNWLQAVCVPLAYLHEKKQLHLNVKPANIRVTSRGEVFLVDTGLPGLGLPMGTSGYASPEQQAQMEVTAVSDIYSLGATLYALLTGKVPTDALHRQTGLADLPPAREVNPDIEPYLSVVAGRAMELRVEVRYENAAAFSRALERPAGRPVERDSRVPRRTSPAQDTPPPRPRLHRPKRKTIEQRTIWGLLALLILFAGMGLGVTMLGRRPLAGGSAPAATATTQSQLIAALTAIAPTPSATPEPTTPPTPSPVPIVSITGGRMIFMPGGIFTMGNEEGENDEQPEHIVRLDSYYIDETEVTNGQYVQCVGAGACRAPFRPGSPFPGLYGDAGYEDYPVILVSWNDAATFCEWRGARLPTEAEWERAAGFDPVNQQRLQYPWGEAFEGARLNFCDANCTRDNRNTEFNDGYALTAPVASYGDGRSTIGLYDMAGNVMEWVADWYGRRYYQDAPDKNPLGPPEGEYKAIRGGSWLSSADEVTVTVRTFFEPSVARAHLGFRCALNPP